jgi:hypothetical protein
MQLYQRGSDTDRKGETMLAPKLPSRRMMLALQFVLALCVPAAAMAEEIVRPDVLINTENAVFLNDGRYFVAGSAGVHQIKREADTRPGCQLDPARGLTLCTVLPPEFRGDVCLYSGLTTDGETLYAACTVTDGSALAALAPTKAALIRIRPKLDAYEIAVSYFEQPTWYNGMAMIDGKTLLMSRSLTGTIGTVITGAEGPAIDRVEITNPDTLALRVRPWLAASPAYLLPNGIQVENGYAYFVGGQNVFRIRIRPDGSAGVPALLYQTPINHTFDDLIIVGDYLAIAEIAILNGLGVNSITFVKKTGSLFPRRIATGNIQISSLAVDPGTFGAAGALIGTSFFQGGIHRFENR